MLSVTLLNHVPLWVCAHAVRTCWESHGMSDTTAAMAVHDECGPKDRALIDKVGNKFKHASTLEHLYYNFFFEDFSRAVLQELARHRIASPSVKSTRYTLKELKTEASFTTFCIGEEKAFISSELGSYSEYTVDRASKYLVWTGDPDVDAASIAALENLRKLVAMGKPNDVSKYALPDAYKTKATWSCNARSLQNFISLRTDKAALWEIRNLANAVFNALPEDHRYLFEHCLYKEKD